MGLIKIKVPIVYWRNARNLVEEVFNLTCDTTEIKCDSTLFSWDDTIM